MKRWYASATNLNFLDSTTRSKIRHTGIPAGRLEQAEADGRLGVSQSIVGRVADLGGSATVRSGADGTEWEISVPRRG